jgi:uncharacterized membrane protein
MVICVESRISIGAGDCYVGGDDVFSNQRRSPMFKKILVSGLVGSIVLSLPIPAQAKVIQNGTSRASGVMIAQNTLSAGDRQAIRQMLQKMIQATNNGNASEVVAGFSPNYQDGSNSRKGSYRNIRSSMRMMVAFMKSYGVTLSAQNIQVTSTGRNQALVDVGYKVDISPEVIEEMTPEERQRYQQNQAKTQGNMLFTLEKTNGRWLIVSMVDPSKNNNNLSIPVAGGTMTVRDAAPTKPSSTSSTRDRQAVKSLFARHLQALNREDLKNYLTTLDSKSPKYDQVKQQTSQLFQDYDLNYELKSLEIVSLNDSSGVVKMVAIVKRKGGGSFSDSKIVTYNTVHKSKGAWHISDTEIESLTALR